MKKSTPGKCNAAALPLIEGCAAAFFFARAGQLYQMELSVVVAVLSLSCVLSSSSFISLFSIYSSISSIRSTISKCSQCLPGVPGGAHSVVVGVVQAAVVVGG